MRKPIIAGNWKMYKTAVAAKELVAALAREAGREERVEVVVCPPFTALAAVGPLLAGTNIALGAQDLHWLAEGAFTGEIAPAMLTDLGCQYVIIGHSERRGHFHETDIEVNRKTQAALTHNLVPIVCVGESLTQHEAGQTAAFVQGQVRTGLAGLGERASRLAVAYEPIWAIGTGRSSTGEDANEVIRMIRVTLAEMYGAAIGDAIRILYGGSVKPGNIKEFMAYPDIDGALVGGASLEAGTFVPIVRYYA